MCSIEFTRGIYMSKFNDFLKELRGKESLRSVSERTGLSHSYIADLEKGYRRGTKKPIHPSADTLNRLAKAYNYPPKELLKKAGYIEETNDDTADFDEILNDPDFEIFFHEYKGSPEENRKKALEFLKFLNKQEDFKK